MELEQTISLAEIPAESRRRFGAHSALAESNGLGGDSLTYDQLWDHVQRGAACLRKAGLKPGERLLLCMEPSRFWAPAFFSVLKAGLIVVPVVRGTPLPVLNAMAVHAGVSGVLASEPAVEAPAGLPVLTASELFAPGPRRDRSEGAPFTETAMLAFTSGSTRHPMAVRLTHGNLLGDLKALLAVRGAGPGDVFLSMLPPAHLFELMGGLLGPLACGAKVVYPGLPLPNRLMESLRTDGITHACCVPGLLQCLYEEILGELASVGIIDAHRRHQDVAESARRMASELEPAQVQRIVQGIRARMGESFRTLVLGGAHLPPEWPPILAVLGIRAEVGYGLTEASPIVSLGLGSECPSGSVGKPLPGIEVRIGGSGEILVRGPNVTPGYFRNEEASRLALKGGWLHTGDCGRLDDRGFLFVSGRLKEAMVTSSGETLYPEEVEPYYQSPLFAEWCVAGRPGPDGNDLPTLFVVPAGNGAGQQRINEAFQELRAAAPARYRVDKMVTLRDRLPRTALGKPRRRLVLASWTQQTERRHHETGRDRECAEKSRG